jgi:hypothetical protein
MDCSQSQHWTVNQSRIELQKFLVAVRNWASSSLLLTRIINLAFLAAESEVWALTSCRVLEALAENLQERDKKMCKRQFKQRIHVIVWKQWDSGHLIPDASASRQRITVIVALMSTALILLSWVILDHCLGFGSKESKGVYRHRDRSDLWLWGRIQVIFSKQWGSRLQSASLIMRYNI